MPAIISEIIKPIINLRRLRCLYYIRFMRIDLMQKWGAGTQIVKQKIVSEVNRKKEVPVARNFEWLRMA